MKKFFSLLVFLCLFVACHTVAPLKTALHPEYVTNPAPSEASYVPDIVPVYVDKDFNVIEKLTVFDAISEWNFTLNGYRQYRIEDDKFEMQVSVLKKVSETNQGLVVLALHEVNMPEDAAPGVLAWVNELGSPIVFVAVDRIGTRDLKLIIMHEIAHTLGVPHIKVFGSLMSPYYQAQTNCIDRLTVQQLAFIRRNLFWHYEHMNYCDRP